MKIDVFRRITHDCEFGETMEAVVINHDFSIIIINVFIICC